MASISVARQSLVEQVREAVIDLLRDEQYTAGSYIPSEQELGERFSASRATVREALKGLVQEGLLDCRHGKGYFVLSREAVFHKPVTHLQSVTELMGDMGYTVENRVLRIHEEMPSPQVRRQLQLDETQSILRLERVRCSRGEPLIYSIDLFARVLIPGAWQELDWSGSLLQLFDERVAQRYEQQRCQQNCARRLAFQLPRHGCAWNNSISPKLASLSSPRKIITEVKIFSFMSTVGAISSI
jgi:GntR family transcriptional regulator